MERPWLSVRIVAERISTDGHHEVQLGLAVQNDAGEFLFAREYVSDRWLRLNDALVLPLDVS